MTGGFRFKCKYSYLPDRPMTWGIRLIWCLVSEPSLIVRKAEFGKNQGPWSHGPGSMVLHGPMVSDNV